MSKPSLIGVIHIPALPGSHEYGGDMNAILQTVAQEAQIFASAKVDAIILENMHDRPYLNGAVGPETTAAMTAVAVEARRYFAGLCGIQILAGANKEALAVALAANLDFIRAEGFVFAHVADEGLIEAQAGALLRYRRNIGAEHVQIWTDIKKKHSAHAITADVSLAETAKAAEFFCADALIVTGSSTGQATSPSDLKAVKNASSLPVYIGSGITIENVADYSSADGFIVGSSIKTDGHWASPLDEQKVRALKLKMEN
ncbi:MAG: BtpA/SgcQ family protein [Bacteroidia bacterium]